MYPCLVSFQQRPVKDFFLLSGGNAAFRHSGAGKRNWQQQPLHTARRDCLKRGELEAAKSGVTMSRFRVMRQENLQLENLRSF